MATTFPTTFPQQQLVELAGYLRNPASGDVKKAVEDLYDVLGWGLGAFLGQPHAMQACPCPCDPSDGPACAKALEEFANQHGEKLRTAQPAALPAWLLPLLLQVAQQLLAQWLTPKPA